ncbi:MAG: hypothetical protein M0021_11845 [Clostridia bacterium]|nr:hypothetical protein [Clostridia bacterium]
MPVKGDYRQYTDPDEEAKITGNFLRGFLYSSKIPYWVKWIVWIFILCSSLYFFILFFKNVLLGNFEVVTLTVALFQGLLVYFIFKKLISLRK